jgi:hypothetical protein
MGPSPVYNDEHSMDRHGNYMGGDKDSELKRLAAHVIVGSAAGFTGAKLSSVNLAIVFKWLALAHAGHTGIELSP